MWINQEIGVDQWILFSGIYLSETVYAMRDRHIANPLIKLASDVTAIVQDSRDYL